MSVLLESEDVELVRSEQKRIRDRLAVFVATYKTQAAAAEAMPGVGAATISKLLRCERNVCKRSTLAKIAEACGVSFDELVYGRKP